MADKFYWMEVAGKRFKQPAADLAEAFAAIRAAYPDQLIACTGVEDK